MVFQMLAHDNNVIAVDAYLTLYCMFALPAMNSGDIANVH